MCNEQIVYGTQTAKDLSLVEMRMERLCALCMKTKAEIEDITRYYSESEAARYLGITETELYRMTRDGVVEFECFEDGVFYDLRELANIKVFDEMRKARLDEI